jgi:hypothetical protein
MRRPQGSVARARGRGNRTCGLTRRWRGQRAAQAPDREASSGALPLHHRLGHGLLARGLLHRPGPRLRPAGGGQGQRGGGHRGGCLALGWFEPGREKTELRRILVDWWEFQANHGQQRWETFWRAGAISKSTAAAWADEAWAGQEAAELDEDGEVAEDAE